MKRIKFFSLVILGSFLMALVATSAFSQSYWERRQQSQEQLRKKQLGTPAETAPKEETAPQKEEQPAPVVTPAPKKEIGRAHV